MSRGQTHDAVGRTEEDTRPPITKAQCACSRATRWPRKDTIAVLALAMVWSRGLPNKGKPLSLVEEEPQSDLLGALNIYKN